MMIRKQSGLLLAPWRKNFRGIVADFFHKINPPDPANGLYFIRIDIWIPVGRPEKNRANFIFHDTIFRKTITIGQRTQYLYIFQAQFFFQSPLYGDLVFLAKSGMSAATVRPNQRPGFFLAAALLKQKFFLRVE